ncbi:MAG: hypothetical protein BWK79_15125 [Beggiatoa sp. IS2]|nr:MAG: hypothetical protein BWK79_15125 [Beggiatoa sp. IS2]
MNDDFVNLDYLCPYSHTRLQATADSLCSSDDRYTYPVRHGIPIFLRYPSADSAEAQATLARLNEQAKIIGWDKALQQVYGDNPDFLKYVTQRNRSIFLEVIPFTPTSKVLEIGPGLGQFTGLIAARAREVYALEVVEGQAQFVAEYCQQAGIQNVQVACGGDDCTLPYCNETFDVVVLNLVFEWCGSRSTDESHLDAQLRLLAEMHRVLKPGGALYLATKNRFALKYLLGKGDEHAYNLRFGNALPRWLLNLRLKWRGKDRPEGFLHSYGQLKHMLSTQGFGDIQAFWAAPEIRYPDRLIPTDTQTIRAARAAGGFRQGDLRSVKLIMRWLPSFLVKYVTPGLTFLAIKSL